MSCVYLAAQDPRATLKYALGMATAVPARLRDSSWQLIRRTMGSPAVFWDKLARLGIALWGYGRSSRVEARLRRLHQLGHVDVIPTRIQRMVGAIDMMRFFIVPCAADYYQGKGISFSFHVLLRFLDDPASVIDPTGFNSSRDAIIGHVMQVVHANPHYDFQLLDTFDDGMEEMEQQVVQVLQGTHPRTASIQAIVEDPDYHRRLLEHVRAYRRNHAIAPLLRENIVQNQEFQKVECTFGTVHAAMRYFSKLPSNPVKALWHVLTIRKFPEHLAEIGGTATSS